MGALVDRPVPGRVAADRDDVVAGRPGRPRSHVQLRVLETGDLGQPVRPAVEPDRRDDPGRRGIDERHPVGRRRRDPGDILDLDPGQAPVGDRRLDLRPHLARAGAPEDDRGAGPRQVLLVVGRDAAEDLDEHGRLRGRIVDELGRRDERGTVAAVGQVDEPWQVHATDDRAGREVERIEVVAGPDHDRGAVLRDVQEVHGPGHLAEWLGRDPAGGRLGPDGRQFEGGQSSVVAADHELLAALIDGQGAGPGRRDRRDQ